MVRIAVVGSGISGMSAAYYLSKVAVVDLIEASPRIGGHTRPIPVSDPTLGDIQVDTGFIVYNDANYPHFIQLMADLDVAVQHSDMSFSFESPTRNVVWGSDFPSGVFSAPRTWISPSHYRFLWGIDRFNKQCLNMHATGIPVELTLGQFIDQMRVPQTVVINYVLPMTSAIWSASYADSLRFPMRAFVRFWKNHQLLELGKGHQWKTITGSARSYIDRLLPNISGKIITDSPAAAIYSIDQRVTIDFKDGSTTYDAVVVATHADTAYKLLKFPQPKHHDTLGKWAYSNNKVVFHTDNRLMPSRRSAWCSWNVRESSGDTLDRPAAVTYWMNRLQSIASNVPYLVTLNPSQPIDPARVISSTTLTHPIMSKEAMETQSALPELNNGSRIVFAGSYFGYGFHEDGIKSSVDAVSKLKATLGL